MQGCLFSFLPTYLCALSLIIFELSPIIIEDESPIIIVEEVSVMGACIIVLLSVDVEVSLPLPHAVKTPAKAMIAKNFFIVLGLFYIYLTVQM